LVWRFLQCRSANPGGVSATARAGRAATQEPLADIIRFRRYSGEEGGYKHQTPGALVFGGL